MEKWGPGRMDISCLNESDYSTRQIHEGKMMASADDDEKQKNRISLSGMEIISLSLQASFCCFSRC